jgi:integrase
LPWRLSFSPAQACERLTISERMGHRDIKTTMIYADYSPSERERERVEAAFACATTRAAKQRATERTEIN